jgi:hypothetical protein
MQARRWTKFSAVVLVGLFSGCATHITFDVQPTQMPPASAKGFVKIAEVRDNRRFEVAPKDPFMPSLQNPGEVNSGAITSRTIGRQRDSNGKAWGNVFLPDGRTVELVVREAVTEALAELGYAVVDVRSPQFEKALPMQVDIEQFWTWFTPRPLFLGGGSVEFRGVLVLKAEALIGRKEVIASGYAIGKSVASAEAGLPSTGSEWRNVVVAGVDDLVTSLKAMIRTSH